jgi:predicted metal-binding protein
MKEYRSHLFVCTNSPDKPGKCGGKNSEAMRRELKERCKSESWGQDVRINASGCLGACEHGIAAVLYPEAKWFLDLTEKDGEVLFQAVKESATSAKSGTNR